MIFYNDKKNHILNLKFENLILYIQNVNLKC